MFLPAGHPMPPMIDHEPSDIEHAAAPATNNADPVDSDMDIGSILNSVFDQKAPKPGG